jgi:hypothetical protein
MSSWHSYPSIFTLGHKALTGLLDAPVNVEEKVDGSQFSFSLCEDGELRVRSKGAMLHPDAPEKMFAAAVATAKSLAPNLRVGWTYRGEYLAKPKHNALAYERIPRQHIIVFDVNRGHEDYLPYDEKRAECDRLGLECVPLLFSGVVSGIEHFRTFLDTPSVLGGQKIEGVVVKQAEVRLFGPDKKALIAKFVSEAFKEVHSNSWKETSPGKNDILLFLGEKYRTSARWAKAAQRLKEVGKLEGSPRDIGPLLNAVPPDIEKECRADIEAALWAWAWPHIRRMATRGLPEWWKEELLKRQFDAAPTTGGAS